MYLGINGRGPICPVCKKVSIELKKYNGQSMCFGCAKLMKRGEEIKVFKRGGKNDE